MKKYILIFVLAAFSTTTFAQITSSNLSRDNDFIKYVTNFNGIVDYLKANFSRNMYTTMQTEIGNLKNQGLSKKDELKAVSKLFNYTDIAQLEIIFDNISLSHAALIQKFGTIDTDVFLVSYKTVTENQSSNSPSNAVPGCRRPWRYALCCAAVGVQGAGILAACETVSAGVATPLCLAAAITFAADGIADCAEKYCDPIPSSVN